MDTMKKIKFNTLQLFITLTLVILAACKPADFKMAAPTAMTGGSAARTTFDHSKFNVNTCAPCHEATRPISVPVHGNGQDCANCHTPTPNSLGAISWLNLAHYDHNPMPTSCLNCHSTSRPTQLAPHMTGQRGATADCATCHIYPTWKPAIFNHAITTLTSCAECHRTTTKDDRPVPKMSHPSAFYNQLDCYNCHTNADNSKVWDNTALNNSTNFNHHIHQYKNGTGPASCNQCHEIKRPLSHTVAPMLPGMEKADCKSCHTSTSIPDGWKQHSAFDHVTSAPPTCLGCHATSIPANQTLHPSTAAKYFKVDCVYCHTYTTVNNVTKSFTNVLFNHHTHSPSPATCTNCHGDPNANDTRPVTGTHNAGVRSNYDCATCHSFDSVNKWKNFTNFKHTLLTASDRCDSCHTNLNNITLTARPTDTVHTSTTGLDCKSCHNPTNFVQLTDWVNPPPTYTHAPSDTNCISCHNGTLARGVSANHIPTTKQCNLCHVQSQSSFAPSMKVTHTVESVATTTDCSSCHKALGVTATTATAMSNNIYHTGAPANCSSCHKSISSWVSPIAYTHPSTASTCSSCHLNAGNQIVNGFTIVGKNATHIPTTLECSSCHIQSQSSFKPSKKNTHSAEAVTSTRTCTTCHNGTNYTPTKPTDIVHTNELRNCGVCHNVNDTAWPGTGTVYQHASTVAAGSCGTCHNNTTAKGPTSGTHIPLTGATGSCDSCHTMQAANFTTGFTMNHSVVTVATCTSCHSGTYISQGAVGALAKPSNHMPLTGITGVTATDCTACHTGTTSWAATKFHTKFTITAQCEMCHYQGAYMAITKTGTTGTTTQRPNTTTHTSPSAIVNNCQACHTSTVDWLTGLQFHTTATALGTHTCNTCHDTGTSSSGKKPSVGHVPYPSTTSCDDCHNSQTSFTTPYTMNHAKVVTTCSTCHNGNFTTQGTSGAKAKIANHIPTTLECSTCHTATNNYSVWTNSLFHTNNPSVTTGCATCHYNTTYAATLFSGIGQTTITQMPATTTHSGVTGNCESCHHNTSRTNFASASTAWASGVSFTHASNNLVGSGTCTTCHGAGTAGNGLKITTRATHIPTTTISCDNCHLSQASFATTVTTNHTSITAIACNTCHNGSFTTEMNKPTGTGALGLVSNHIPAVTGVTITSCNTCHVSTSSWGSTKFHTSITVTDYCTTCHQATSYKAINPAGSTATTTLFPTATHIPITGTTTVNCNKCHKATDTTFTAATMDHASVATAVIACKTCHSGSYTTQKTPTGQGALGKVSNHIPHETAILNGATLDCSACHTSTTAWTTEKMNHNNTQGSGTGSTTAYCKTCHASGGTTYLGNMQKMSITHYQKTPVPLDCSTSGCHKPLGSKGTVYSKWSN